MKRRRRPLVVAAVVLLAIAAGAAWWALERRRDEAARAALAQAASLASENRDATAVFASIDAKRVDAKEYASLRAAIEARKSGRFPLVFDRDGKPLALYELTSQSLVATSADFAPLVAGGARSLASFLPQLGSAASLETTLDPRVQRAALAALGNYRGSLVAIDPRTNELLAVASNTPEDPRNPRNARNRETGGAGDNLAFEQQYEPGSVVKVLTGLNAFDANVAVAFPYDDRGVLDVDGKSFTDWQPGGHGTLASLDEALAVSCNIVFADLGLRLGGERVRSFMARAGFDGQTNVGLLDLPLGRFTAPAATRDDVAHLAIGLEHESITALHLAMLASMMANRGVLTAPRLVRARRNVLGATTWSAAAPASARLASEQAAATMIRAMQAVVTDPRGTGRRAEVPGVTIAMKTGTAGTAAGGYDALIMAFAPVESPRIAFAVIAENAGHAELAGAQITHDFVSSLLADARSGSTGTPAATAPAPAARP